MVIIYESKTGFTKKYADMLATAIGVKAYTTKEIGNIQHGEEVIFLGWIKAGKVQGLKKVRPFNLKAVCASGTADVAKPDEQIMAANNGVADIPFFYLQGGCLPLGQLKGMDKLLLTMFARMLKNNNTQESQEAVDRIINGYDGVKEENLAKIIDFLQINKGL